MTVPGMTRHGFLLSLRLAAHSCGSPSEAPNVASEGEPTKERQSLYYDFVAIQSHSYMDQGANGIYLFNFRHDPRSG